MVVTLHDLVPLKRRSEYLRSGLRFRLRYLAVQRAVRVIVPTAAVADDARQSSAHARERIVVIPEAAAPAFRPRGPRRWTPSASAIACPRTTCSGSAGCARPILASASPRWPGPAHDAARARRPDRPLGPRAARTSAHRRVNDDELAAIYTGAHALVFPSDDEGFGLPPVEALACGTPVAACDVPALREVLDGRAR